jgi:hypothetical protein
MKGHNNMGAQSPDGVASHLDPKENTRPGLPSPTDRPFPTYTVGDSTPNQERTEAAPDPNESTMDFSKKFA